jgi:ribosome-associated protein
MDDELTPSKTQRKKSMHALQDLGERLSQLSTDRIRKLKLPETLEEALILSKSITQHGALRRQHQLIGKLMRQVEVETVQQQLNLWEQPHQDNTRVQHQAEAWRTKMLTNPEGLDQWMEQFPQTDRQQFRQKILTIQEDQTQNKPLRHYRTLFRLILAQLTAAPHETP